MVNPKAYLTRFPFPPFVLFKCFIYSALCLNFYFYILDDLSAAQGLLQGAWDWREFSNVFAVSIDTGAWIALLVVFEIETSVLNPESTYPAVSWLLAGISAACYISIAYAFTSYLGKYFLFSDVIPYNLGPVCDLVGSGFYYTPFLDEYIVLDSDVCSQLTHKALGQFSHEKVIYALSDYDRLLNLSRIQVVNSGTWILVVLILQLEIMFSLGEKRIGRLSKATTLFKGLLYANLILVALYWGVNGEFIDGWDASLWLLGFVVIELNIFNFSHRPEILEADLVS